MQTEIEEIQYKRFRVLYELYKASKGNTTNSVELKEIAAKHEIKNGLFAKIIDYLVQDTLIKETHFEFGSDYKITHSGIKAVEWVVTNPEKRSDQFPPFKEMGL